MVRLQGFISAAALALVLASGVAAHGAPAVPTPAWSALRYESRSLLGRVGGELALREDAPAQGWIADVKTFFEPKLYWHKVMQIRSWFDPQDGRVSQTIKRTLQPDPDEKIYRFSERGAHRVRIEPNGPDARDGGQHVRESFHGYDAAALGCDVVSDPAALLVRIAAESGEASTTRHCVFSGKTLFSVDVEPGDRQRLRVDYRLHRGDAVERRQGEIDARQVRVHARPVAGEMDEEPIDVEILVDEHAKLPVELRSDVAGFGKVGVPLVEVAG
jgi:hypothetical protein